MIMSLYSTVVTIKNCGFLERADGHFGSYTCGSGTFCSDCSNRIFNPHYSGAMDVESDMEIVDKLRKEGTTIPKKIQEEITKFQDKVDWKPRWIFSECFEKS